jgi:hypothetical protein
MRKFSNSDSVEQKKIFTSSEKKIVTLTTDLDQHFF